VKTTLTNRCSNTRYSVGEHNQTYSDQLQQPCKSVTRGLSSNAFYAKGNVVNETKNETVLGLNRIIIIIIIIIILIIIIIIVIIIIIIIIITNIGSLTALYRGVFYHPLAVEFSPSQQVSIISLDIGSLSHRAH